MSQPDFSFLPPDVQTYVLEQNKKEQAKENKLIAKYGRAIAQGNNQVRIENGLVPVPRGGPWWVHEVGRTLMFYYGFDGELKMSAQPTPNTLENN